MEPYIIVEKNQIKIQRKNNEMKDVDLEILTSKIEEKIQEIEEKITTFASSKIEDYKTAFRLTFFINSMIIKDLLYASLKIQLGTPLEDIQL